MVLIFILIFVYNDDVSGTFVNLARNKQVRLCNNTIGPNEMVDDNRHQLAQSITETCTASYDVEILMQGHFYVHWVVIYGTSPGIDVGEIPLYVDKFGSRTDECGASMMNKIIGGRSIRINCINNDKYHLKVMFKLRVVPFQINEIELHTLASGINMQTTSIYRGCFKNFTSQHTIDRPINDLKICQKLCASNSYSFAAIKNKKKCYCGNVYNDNDLEPTENKCNIKCARMDQFCGGTDHYSIYLVSVKLPYFLGCVDYNVFGSSMIRGNMTISKCLMHCDYSMFAILEQGDHCHCTNESYQLQNYFENFNKCNSVCSGDSKNYCGGREASTIFGTCVTALGNSLTCSRLFRCSGSWNEYGVCTDGCVENYGGDYCLRRETTTMVSITSELALAMFLLVMVLCLPMMLLLCLMNGMVREVIRDRQLMDVQHVIATKPLSGASNRSEKR